VGFRQGRILTGYGLGRVVALIIVGALTCQCSQGNEERSEAPKEDQVADRAADIRAGSYEDARGDEGCTSDCSGHEAGFEWAKDNDITSEDDCSSHGDTDGSFAEGCKAYVNAEETAADEGKDEDAKESE
jgi:hypothetical protein